MSPIADKDTNPSTILVFQTAFLGDVILVTPLLNAIRERFPNSQLATMVLPEFRSVVSSISDFTLTFDKKSDDPEKEKKAINQISELAPGIAFIPHRSFRSGKMVRDAEVPRRVGFDRGEGAYFHTDKIPYLPWLYEGARNLSLLKPFTDKSFPGLPCFPPAIEERQTIEKLIAELELEPSKFIVAAPASVWATKAWPAVNYKRFTEMAKESGFKTVIVGGKSDREALEGIVPDIRLNLCGRLSPLESLELMRKCAMVISGDSAAAHLATAAGARQLILLGSTSQRFGFVPPVATARTLGLDLWCRPCNDHGRKKCPRFQEPKCLTDISPEMVWESVNDWLT